VPAASQLVVGMILHLAFSILVGIVFITILFGLQRAGLGLLRTAPATSAPPSQERRCCMW